jgi:uncharacterized protein YkwD
MRFLAVLVAASAAVLVTSPAATPGSTLAPKVERRTALGAAVIREMNRVRAARGLHALHAVPGLRTAALSHSQSMLANDFFGHESADGTPFSERIKRYYSNRGWRTWSVGETLLASEGSTMDAAAIVAAWLQSPPHREIVLESSWRDAGIGVLYAPSAPHEFGGAEAIVVTADFGLREGRADSQ